MTPIPHFRILYRQFLFRLMDVELLSASAGGDASGLFGQFGALLIFGSVLLSFGAISIGQGIRDQALAAPLWSAEQFLICVTMLATGTFAILSWDSTFLDRRDVLVLGPLPVCVRSLVASKIAAAASAQALIESALHCLSGFAWPIMMAPHTVGVLGTLRFLGAFWIALLAAGAFLYCSVLGVQALAAQLPRRWYLRISPLLQIAALVLFLGVLFFQPYFSGAAALAAPQNQSALMWLPPYWFLGLLSEWSGLFPVQGHAVMAPLAQRALLGLLVAVLVAGGAFLLSYFRVLRKIVEEPDVTPGARGGMRLPRFGSAPQTALAQFVIRTLWRSRQHRMILAFYLGGGFAIVAVYLGGARAAMHLSAPDLVRRVNAPLLVATVLMLCASWLGTRTAFSLPIDLRANWLFRITPAPSVVNTVAAVRRALLVIAVLPVWAASAALLLWFWPWAPAAGHLLVLGLLGSLLADISLRGFRKIPFTCSYLPGKSKVHMLFWFAIIPVVVAIHKLIGMEQRAMENPVSYWTLTGILGGTVAAARFASNASAQRNAPEIQFEETSAEELVSLDLRS
jgi:hypothetical protein